MNPRKVEIHFIIKSKIEPSKYVINTSKLFDNNVN